MTNEVKSKKNAISNIRQMIKPGESYFFPENTVMKLYYFEELVDNTMIEIKSLKNGSVVVITDANGNREMDNIKEFAFSEIKMMHDFISEDLEKASSEGRIVYAPVG